MTAFLYIILYNTMIIASAEFKKRCGEFYQLPRTCFACSSIFLVKLYSAISISEQINKHYDVNAGVYGAALVLLSLSIIIDTIAFCLQESGTPHPIYKLLEIYATQRTYDEDRPLLSYSMFKKIYSLHPENFYIINDRICPVDITFKYHDTPFCMNFIDFIRALELVYRDKERFHKTKYWKNHTQSLRNKKFLYNLMRDDLARDLETIEKQKKDAYDKIKTAAENIEEITTRLQEKTK